jgi:hypothetical protein
LVLLVPLGLPVLPVLLELMEQMELTVLRERLVQREQLVLLVLL